MNKYTVRQLFKRAYEVRLRELGDARWEARRKCEERDDVKALNSEIKRLTVKRDKIVSSYVKPIEKKAAAERELLKKQYRDLDIRMGFAITNEERKVATEAIKAFLKSLPNCPEAKLI